MCVRRDITGRSENEKTDGGGGGWRGEGTSVSPLYFRSGMRNMIRVEVSLWREPVSTPLIKESVKL